MSLLRSLPIILKTHTVGKSSVDANARSTATPRPGAATRSATSQADHRLALGSRQQPLRLFRHESPIFDRADFNSGWHRRRTHTNTDAAFQHWSFLGG